MFNKRDKRSKNQKEIDRLLILMGEIEDPASSEYLKLLKTLESLEKIESERQKPTKFRVSPDAILGLVGTIGVALLVINHEEVGNVVSSKAFSFIPKSRV